MIYHKNPVLFDHINIFTIYHNSEYISKYTYTIAPNDIYTKITKEWKLKNIAILVNNAGFGLTGEFLNQNIQRIETMINVNVMACIRLGHLFGRHFVKQGYGRIMQICSVAAYVPGSHASIHHATKSMLLSWCKSFQMELASTGVGITIISPGPVKTNFIKASDSQRSLVFKDKCRCLTATPAYVAKKSVNATLKGKREIMVGSSIMTLGQSFLGNMGTTFNMLSVKLFWQNNIQKSRSLYKKFNYYQ